LIADKLGRRKAAQGAVRRESPAKSRGAVLEIGRNGSQRATAVIASEPRPPSGRGRSDWQFLFIPAGPPASDRLAILARLFWNNLFRPRVTIFSDLAPCAGFLTRERATRLRVGAPCQSSRLDSRA
jgi:hypothetical protein